MRARGFTLIELITVMVLIGIMAVVAVPRFFDRSVFDSRGLLDETKSLLRYAQKAAVAQRRTVCVALGGSGVTLTIASAANVNTCDTALALPSVPVGGVGLVPSVASFQFRSLGNTDQGSNVTISVTGATGNITVDRVTGYVY
ncbi:MAG: GspH/FimT family pseudopilin [Betaproteobacteria bacterium]